MKHIHFVMETKLFEKFKRFHPKRGAMTAILKRLLRSHLKDMEESNGQD